MSGAGICCRSAAVVSGRGWNCPEHGESSNHAEAMSAERCPTCDRGGCRRVEVVGPIEVAANIADCEANRVDWRARARATEQQRDTVGDELSGAWAERDRLRDELNRVSALLAIERRETDRLRAFAATVATWRNDWIQRPGYVRELNAQAQRVLRGEDP